MNLFSSNTYPKIIDSINYLNLFSALYLVAVLPFYYTFQHLAILLFFSTYAIEFLIDRKWKLFTWDKAKWLFLVFFTFFSLVFIFHLFEDNSFEYYKLLEKRLPFFAIAFIGMFGLNSKYKLDYFAVMFVITAISIILYLIFCYVGIQKLISDPFPDQIFRYFRIKFVNTHMVFNFYLNTALIFCFYLISKFRNIKFLIIKTLLISSALIIYLILLTTEGRSGFLAANLVFFGFILYYIWLRKRVLAWILIIVFPILLFSFLENHPRMQTNNVKTEGRLVLWPVAVDLIKEKPFWGYGPSTAREIFSVELQKVENSYFQEKREEGDVVDTHNQFLQILLEFGVIGLLFSFAIYILPIILSPKSRRIYMLFFILISINQSIFDMFITGQFSLIFTFVVLLMISIPDSYLKKGN